MAAVKRFTFLTALQRNWRYIAVLAVASAYAPLDVLLRNLDKFPHAERLLLLIGAYLAVGLIWRWVLIVSGVGSKASTASAFVLSFLLSASGRLAVSMSTFMALAVSFAIPIILALLLNQREPVSHAVVSGLTTLVVVMLGVVWLQNLGSEGGNTQINPSTFAFDGGFQSHPDIFLIVLDGFPGERAISEVYKSRVDFAEVSGVTRAEAWAAYPMTIASMSSFLNMNYPLEDGAVIDAPTSGSLARIMSGDNRFTRLMRDEGYVATVVESGYSRSFCSEEVDVCIASAFLDEGTFQVVRKSALGSLLNETRGSGFTVGSLHTMSWLEENLPRLATDDKPDFVFASVLAPHPPLFLDESCAFVYEYWRSGNSVFGGDWLIDDRQTAFISQARCVARFETRLLESVPDDAVLILLSDHGGDSLGQLARENHVWSRTEVVERLNTHLAIRTPDGCSFKPVVMLPDVLGRLVSCLSGGEDQITTRPARMFTARRIPDTAETVLHELSPQTVGSLVSDTTSVGR